MVKQTNPWQKLVRGAIRDLINDVNSSQSKSSKPKKKKSKPKKKKFKKVSKTKKRSRYIPDSVRVNVLTRDNYRCVFCGVTSKEAPLEVDHIIPFAQGGSNDPSNLQTLCRRCNQGKGNRIL